MKWIKKGLVLPCKNYMQLPTVEVQDDLLKIYFATRNQEVSSIKYLMCNLDWEITEIGDVLSHGNLGTFSDSGVMPSSICNGYLYYTGWHLRKSVPYGQAIGVYSSNHLNCLVLSDPYLCNSAFVMYDNNCYKMWYVSGTGWYEVDGKQKPAYQINYAVSPNAVHWKIMQVRSVPNEKDESISRPCVIKDDDGFKMWYGYMSSNDPNYRIGYAESYNGIRWVRKDKESGINLSEAGWDSEMMSYPYVIDIKGKRYMFYNGNSYGKDGIGVALAQ